MLHQTHCIRNLMNCQKERFRELRISLKSVIQQDKIEIWDCLFTK